jgi:hypothetical protein
MAEEKEMNPYDLNSTSFNPDIFLQKLMKVCKRKQKFFRMKITFNMEFYSNFPHSSSSDK